MKNLLVVLFAVITTFCWSQNYTIGTYSVTIKGTSNLHEWESYCKEVRANGQVVVDATGLKEIKSLYVEIPVKSIKSPKGSVMDGKTYDALKADSNPNITFKMEKAAVSKRGDIYDCNTSGYLKIAGSSKRIDLYAKGKVSGDNVTFSGSKKMRMTDFGIQPPTALMGTLTTGDEVEIVFSVTLKKA